MYRPLTLMLVLAAAPLAGQKPADQIGWLTGCWLSQGGDHETIEMWTPPGGELMVGGSRTVVGGRPRAFEHLRLLANDSGVVYTAIPSGQVETDFTSTEVTDSSFTVENPTHDFPTRLRYLHRRSVDSLAVEVQGPLIDGERRGFTIHFARTVCGLG